MSTLNQLRPVRGANHPAPKRKGRGSSARRGDTCGRGYNGQKSRSGGSIRPGFEGGAVPFYLKTPKSGFSSRKQFVREDLPVGALNRFSGEGAPEVTIESLRSSGLIRKSTKWVKLYKSGKLTGPCRVLGISATKGAIELIESSGGQYIESADE